MTLPLVIESFYIFAAWTEIIFFFRIFRLKQCTSEHLLRNYIDQGQVQSVLQLSGQALESSLSHSYQHRLKESRNKSR